MARIEDGGSSIKPTPPPPPQPYEGGVRAHPNLGPDPGQYTRNLGAGDKIRQYLVDKGYVPLAYPQGPGMTNYFPLLVPPKAAPLGQRGYGNYGGGGGGGGGRPAPPPPGMTIRTAEGSRLTPYFASEPQFFGGWKPYLTILGNTGAWS